MQTKTKRENGNFLSVVLSLFLGICQPLPAVVIGGTVTNNATSEVTLSATERKISRDLKEKVIASSQHKELMKRNFSVAATW